MKMEKKFCEYCDAMLSKGSGGETYHCGTSNTNCDPLEIAKAQLAETRITNSFLNELIILLDLRTTPK